MLAAALEEHRWRAVRIACDLLMLVVAVAIAVLASPRDAADLPLLAYPPLTLALLCSRGRYQRRLHQRAFDDIAKGAGSISIGAMSLFMLSLVTVGDSPTTSSVIAHSWSASLLLVSAAGTMLTLVETAARTRGVVAEPTLIVGADEAGRAMVERLRDHPEHGLRAVGFLDPSSSAGGAAGMPPVLGTLEDLEKTAALHGIRHVIVGFPDADDGALGQLVKRCDELGLDTTVLPRLASSINHRTHFEHLGAMPVLNLRAINPTSVAFGVKYLLDRISAALLLLILAPLLVVIAVAVRLSSPGPILFRQLRNGHDGHLFEMLKFRTMLMPPPGEAVETSDDCDRAPGGVEGADRRTRVGRALRRTSLDELPQLVNVLRGSMSLIGPRPERPEFSDAFRTRFACYPDRQRVRPGITGWAQVHGSRGQTPMVDRVMLDNFYIEHWSPGLDAKILFKTVPAMFKGGS